MHVPVHDRNFCHDLSGAYLMNAKFSHASRIKRTIELSWWETKEKEIWKKYMSHQLNIENSWDGAIDSSQGRTRDAS